MEHDEKQTAALGDETIQKLRKAIDRIDEDILNLINRRLEIALAIGKIKEKNGKPILDAVRENHVIERVLSKNKGPVEMHVLEEIFRQIITGSREIQKKMNSNGS